MEDYKVNAPNPILRQQRMYENQNKKLVIFSMTETPDNFLLG